jgi:hypothetical protein
LECNHEDSKGRTWTFDIGTDEHGPWWNLLTTTTPRGVVKWEPRRIHIGGTGSTEGQAAEDAQHAIENVWVEGATVEGDGDGETLIDHHPLTTALDGPRCGVIKTKKQIPSAQVCDVEDGSARIVGRTVTQDEWFALTADQLREAIAISDRVVVKCGNGSYTLTDPGPFGSSYAIDERTGFYRPSEWIKEPPREIVEF